MLQEIVFSTLLYFFICLFQTTTPTALSKDYLNADTFKTQLLEDFVDKIKKGPIKESKLNYLKRLSDNFYKSPKRINYLLSKSWAAGGMPFNVLYTPNSYQQKILKSKPKNSGGKAKVLKKPKQIPRILNEKSRQQLYKKHFMSRKYYSLIPQLFVSYGW